VARVLRAGAAGYVTKDCEPAALVGAVRKVAAKGATSTRRWSIRWSSRRPQPGFRFAARAAVAARAQVLERIAAGQALGQIADALHLSPKTVSTHKMRLMQKLALQTNADLLKYALRHGITSH
jgi:DNA-binding NarL/FixJ family response regulator